MKKPPGANPLHRIRNLAREADRALALDAIRLATIARLGRGWSHCRVPGGHTCENR